MGPDSTFVFHVREGVIAWAKDGSLFASGVWSGHGAGRNNPAMENVKGVGPLPAGLYRYEGMIDGGHLGPDVMHLVRIDDGPDFGRGHFYVHGATIVNPAMSSDGCIIVDHPHRLEMNKQAGSARTIRVVH